jgi:hypothetical protein
MDIAALRKREEDGDQFLFALFLLRHCFESWVIVCCFAITMLIMRAAKKKKKKTKKPQLSWCSAFRGRSVRVA